MSYRLTTPLSHLMTRWYDLVNHLVKVVQVAQNPSKAFDSFNLTMLSEDRKIFTSSCAGEMGSELLELIVDC